MVERVKVTLKAVRRRTVRVVAAGVRAPCRACRREVEALTATGAAEILGVARAELDGLIAEGRVHAIPTVSGAVLVCKKSLFLR